MVSGSCLYSNGDLHYVIEIISVAVFFFGLFVIIYLRLHTMESGTDNFLSLNSINKRKHSTPKTCFDSNSKIGKFVALNESRFSITNSSQINTSGFLKDKIILPTPSKSNSNLPSSFSESEILSASFQQHRQLKEQQNCSSYTVNEQEQLSWSMVQKDKSLRDVGCIEEILPNSNDCNTTSGITQTRLTNYHPENNLSLSKLLLSQIKWRNPIIGTSKSERIASATSSKVLSKTDFDRIYSSFRFNKAMLKDAQVLGQVDQKFIACLLNTGQENDQILVLIDQHAAHERVRLEKLLRQIGYYTKNNESSQKTLKNQVCSLSPPSEVFFSDSEIDLLLHFTAEFQKAGINFATVKSKLTMINSGQRYRVLFSTVPSIFVNVCTEQNKARGSLVNGDLLKEYILEQSKMMKTCASKCNISSSPVIFKVLASYACHGAIKFGDTLDKETCVKVMRDLSLCQLPFQCAHGRPAIAPLLRFSTLKPFFEKFVRRKPNLRKLKKCF